MQQQSCSQMQLGSSSSHLQTSCHRWRRLGRLGWCSCLNLALQMMTSCRGCQMHLQLVHAKQLARGTQAGCDNPSSPSQTSLRSS